MFFFFVVAEADYTLDDSFWNEETPVGESHLFNYILSDLLFLETSRLINS